MTLYDPNLTAEDCHPNKSQEARETERLACQASLPANCEKPMHYELTPPAVPSLMHAVVQLEAANSLSRYVRLAFTGSACIAEPRLNVLFFVSGVNEIIG